MKLIYRIALRLSLILIPLMALWATLFYFMMVEEINDEADDTRSEERRVYAGRLFRIDNYTHACRQRIALLK